MLTLHEIYVWKTCFQFPVQLINPFPFSNYNLGGDNFTCLFLYYYHYYSYNYCIVIIKMFFFVVVDKMIAVARAVLLRTLRCVLYVINKS